jgi:hypothetical protein
MVICSRDVEHARGVKPDLNNQDSRAHHLLLGSWCTQPLGDAVPIFGA